MTLLERRRLHRRCIPVAGCAHALSICSRLACNVALKMPLDKACG